MNQHRTRDQRSRLLVPQFATRPATMPFDGVDVRRCLLRSS